jgi:hypothetical protein
MTVNEGLRLLAGSMVMASLALGHLVHPAWFLLTAFVGVNLFQSAFTHRCPAQWALRRAGLRDPESR